MFLANHGAVCCGETVEEAFFNVYNTVLACETQVRLLYFSQLFSLVVSKIILYLHCMRIYLRMVGKLKHVGEI
jgi:ribulose-5-phosphate 4-epimerase/fuculose-1-phosphate aldolase